MQFIKYLLQSKKQPFISIDFNHESVKVLEFIPKNNTYELVAYGVEPMPQDAIVNHELSDISLVSDTITKAINKSGSKTKNAAIALSGPSIFVRIIEMSNNLSDEEVESQIQFNEEEYIPNDLEDVNFDFQVLQYSTEEGGYNKIALVACHKSMIEQYSAAVEMANMRVKIIDFEDFAIQNACKLIIHQDKELSDDLCIGFFEIQNEKTFLNIHNKGECVYRREIQINSQDFFDQIKREYQIDNTNQLYKKIEDGELNIEEIKNKIYNHMSNFEGQIERALHFFKSSYTENIEVTHIVFTGSITLFPGFEESLSIFYKYNTRIGNPLLNLKYKNKTLKKVAETKGPELMTVTGLAMRNTL